MSKFNRLFRIFLSSVRSFIRHNTSPGAGRPAASRPGWWETILNGQKKLAQTPSLPRPNHDRRVNDYAGTLTRPKWRKYSPDEVKRILRGLEQSERSQAVMRQAAVFNLLLDDRMIRFFRGRERLFDRLPFVVQQYTMGKACDEIAQKVSYFCDADDIEEAIDFAAGLITNQLNRQR